MQAKSLVNLQLNNYNIIVIGASPSGKATDSDSVIRVFESLRPSQIKSELNTVNSDLYFTYLKTEGGNKLNCPAPATPYTKIYY